jgi:hypothetical protein
MPHDVYAAKRERALKSASRIIPSRARDLSQAGGSRWQKLRGASFGCEVPHFVRNDNKRATRGMEP